ncbi:RagB/SusD family nutrient uptake outer membrane protein [Chitinophaga qingshengii]|uniref:RagB/SusD family nutrient uptake outer membrane protein n=1 Tax=Chitinophaga qingshengii TaxID=1569794 RepID=A0ABR7TIY2_9BACT|nr:RagB/SusD family nutrient uptake outer membrane protein [Chitinophaga qingshengii]MBC9929473.1 RagB/SusD family nutrient uptake outer membrane protein [Chitinophaga qingshengii]
MKRIHIFFVLLAISAGAACNKFVDTPLPKNELVSQLVFTDDKTATAAVTGLYTSMNAYNYQFANVLMNFLSAMQADELYYYTTFDNYDVFRENRLVPSSQYVQSMFADQYSFIYHTNACLEGLRNNNGLSPAVKNQLIGESLFMRSFFYFYLVNMYGDVPLITSTDYEKNGIIPRIARSVVYDTIIKNLNESVALLNDAYPTGTRIRPNRAAANALLARIYLYNQQWTLAETSATKVIGDSKYSLLQDLNKVFLANSGEAIFQLQPVNVAFGRNTWEGFTAAPANATAAAVFRLDTLHLISRFETGDLRLANWTGFRKTTAGATYYFPFKYKVRANTAGPVTEYSMVLRLAEQYLVRAEARIQQGKLDDGRADLDAIRVRAGLPKLATTLGKEDLLKAVEKERHLELFTEWGHRWFDLKRTKQSTAVLQPIKGANWQATDTLYPIPVNAISTNPNLTQNEGYK